VQAVGTPAGPAGAEDAASAEERLVAALEQALEPAWRAWVAAYLDYVAAHAGRETPAPAVIDPRPRVLLLPDVGMVTLGRDARAAASTAEIYHHALGVIRDAETLDHYTSLDAQDCFDVEYWPLELYKLTLAPPEAELSRKVALVTGAASGIGRAIALRLAQDGAHVVAADLNLEGAQAVADQINGRYGGQAGGQRGAGRAIALRTNVADERDVAALFDAAVEVYGGLDVVVSNAGIAPFGLLDELELADWQRSLDVNATGHFLVTRAALRLFKRQGIGGSLIYITTKNVMAPGKEFGAYSAAKSAQAQVARVAALEGGEFGIRANMINPDAIFRGSTLWSPELRRARAETHGTTEQGLEEHYRKRNLLGVAIYAEDVAETAWWLATERARKTTGSVLTVDGGVPAAFPR
jgi:NAD(P)-dependent dehydrogenase (short-subunit alcohol dehydrogenase family)